VILWFIDLVLRCVPSPDSVALAGRNLEALFPGLKAWAILLNHFMVLKRRLRSRPRAQVFGHIGAIAKLL
jgi:hypothetical protein